MTSVKWFVERPYGNFTIEQEFFCWRMALHGNQMRACREAYSSSVGNPGLQNTKSCKLMNKPKVVHRINELVDYHKGGLVDLFAGPWERYQRYDVGSPVDPGNRLTPMIQEIRELRNVEEEYNTD